MFSLKCFFDDMWWMHGWCLYWRFVPCGNCVQNQVHTHTHVTSSTTKNNSILIQSQSISIQFNLSQIIIQKTFSNHLQPQGIIPSFNDSQGLHETESPNCRYPCSDCYTSHTNQLHALDFVCCHGKIHVFLLSSIYIYINVPAKVIRKLAMKLLKCTINPTW